MLKLLASRFADFTPALVNEQQNSVFDANLNALAASEDSDKLLAADAQVSADSNFWLDADNCMARALSPTRIGWIGVGLSIRVRPISAAP